MNQTVAASTPVIIKLQQGVAGSGGGGAAVVATAATVIGGGGGGGGAAGSGPSVGSTNNNNQENNLQQTLPQQHVAVVSGASIVKTNPGPSNTQLVVTPGSKGTTILQPTQGHGGQQYIITTVSGNNAGVGGAPAAANPGGDHVAVAQPAVYPTIQYVDGSTGAAESNIYTNGQSANVQYEYPGYTPVSGYQYHSAQPGIGPTLGLGGLPTLQSQMVHQTGGHTYLIHGGGAMDGEGHPLTHTTRASPATVQWLLDNYETADGVSLPRSTLYNHYMRHCSEQKLDPMNPASFGKLIRSVFLGLRTRRLGTRGNSKYHYYGIRIKGNSPLNQLVPDDTAVAMRQPCTPAAKRLVRPNLGEGGDGVAKSEPGAGGEGGGQGGGAGTGQGTGHQQFLALGRIQEIVPCLEIVFDERELPDGVTEEDTLAFETLYKEHCDSIADVVVNLQFAAIERLWEVFWNSDTASDTNKLARKLPKETLHAMAQWEPVQTFVRQTDCAFYQALVEVLIPDVLRPIPGSLTQAIRNFAKGLEGWLKAAMAGVPKDMIHIKVAAVSSFSQTLRRYTSLNHLAQAARAVLQNSPQIEQMLADLNKVDFVNIQDQASWVCQCEEGLVVKLEADFKKTLQEQRELEDWASWLENVVSQVLSPHREDPTTYPKAAREFLLKWSFYSSMIIRDLTLRSAASFGSFHLIRLLFDEYMFYLIEHRVANATKETPIAVMGEFKQLDDMNSEDGLNFGEFFETKPSAGGPTAINRGLTLGAATGGGLIVTGTTLPSASGTPVVTASGITVSVGGPSVSGLTIVPTGGAMVQASMAAGLSAIAVSATPSPAPAVSALTTPSAVNSNGKTIVVVPTNAGGSAMVAGSAMVGGARTLGTTIVTAIPTGGAAVVTSSGAPAADGPPIKKLKTNM